MALWGVCRATHAGLSAAGADGRVLDTVDSYDAARQRVQLRPLLLTHWWKGATAPRPERLETDTALKCYRINRTRGCVVDPKVGCTERGGVHEFPRHNSHKVRWELVP